MLHSAERGDVNCWDTVTWICLCFCFSSDFQTSVYSEVTGVIQQVSDPPVTHRLKQQVVWVCLVWFHTLAERRQTYGQKGVKSEMCDLESNKKYSDGFDSLHSEPSTRRRHSYRNPNRSEELMTVEGWIIVSKVWRAQKSWMDVLQSYFQSMF